MPNPWDNDPEETPAAATPPAASAAPWDSDPIAPQPAPLNDADRAPQGESLTHLRAMADEAADAHGVPRRMFRGLIAHESAGWDTKARPIGNDGQPLSSAKGLGQLIDSTAAQLGVTDPYDPAQALPAAAKYLADLKGQFGDWEHAVAAYHDGPGKVRADGITDDPDAEGGWNYVNRVADRAMAEPPDAGEVRAPPAPDRLSVAAPANAAAATFKAQNAGITPDAGAQAVIAAQQTGLGPGFVAQNLPAITAAQTAAQKKALLAQAPATAAAAAQSPAHAAAIVDDADSMTFMEWMFGKYQQAPQRPGESSRSYAARGMNAEMIRPPAWQQFLSKAVFGLESAALGAMRGGGSELLSKWIAGPELEGDIHGNVIPAPSRETIRQADEYAAAPVPGTEGSTPREMIGATVEAAPQLVPFLNPATAAPFLWAQTYGQLHNHFEQQTNIDGSPRFTETQSRALSAGGATAATVVLTGIAKKLGGSIAGRLFAKEATDAIGEAAATQAAQKLPFLEQKIASLLDSPQLLLNLEGRALQFGHSMLHGLGFMVGQSVLNDTTEQAGDMMTGGRYDAGRTWQAVKAGAEGAMKLSLLTAIAPVAGAISDVGRSVQAHADAVDFAAAVEAAKASKFVKNAPTEAAKLIDAQSARDPARATAYVKVDAFEKAAQDAGHNPSDVAGALADKGAAYWEARATGGEIAIPMSDVLTKLVPAGIAEKLALDTKMSEDPEAITAREAITNEAERRKLSPEAVAAQAQPEAKTEGAETPAQPAPEQGPEFYRAYLQRFAGTPGVNESAKLYANAILALADKSGLPADEIARRYEVTLGQREGAQGLASVATLMQASQQPAPLWFSPLERAATNAKQAKGTPESWLAVLSKTPGVKAEEIEETGVDQWLAQQKGTVTREQVADYIRAHRVELHERVLGELSGKARDEAVERIGLAFDHSSGVWTGMDWDYPNQYRIDNAAEDGDDALVAKLTEQASEYEAKVKADAESAEDQARRAVEAAEAGDFNKAAEYAANAAHIEKEYGEAPTWGDLAELTEKAADEQFGTHYESYTVGVHKPGTYRELLLTSPAATDYSAPHFEGDSHGVIAHARIGETTDAQGRKVLMVEEIQSDLHQEGRQLGYQQPEPDDRLEQRPFQGDKLPNVPWKDSWEDLMVRRLVRYAAEHGFERIALSPGVVHTERYGTEEIAWEKRPFAPVHAEDVRVEPSSKAGEWLAIAKDGRILTLNRPGDRVERPSAEYAAERLNTEGPRFSVAARSQRGGNAAGINIEDEAARRGLLKEGSDVVTSKDELRNTLRGIDKENLTDKLWDRMQKDDSGGARPRAEGFEQAYDKRLKGAFDKQLKKYGASMRTEAVAANSEAASWGPDVAAEAKSNGSSVNQLQAHVADIPQALRDKVLAEGQPLFQTAVAGTPLAVGPGTERGSITIGAPIDGVRNLTIHLNAPDESTLAHETFHALSVILADLSADKSATPEITALHDTLAREMGYADGAERQKGLDPAKEEKGAAAFEQYLSEGKAPTPELAGVFARFKEWMGRIYGQIRGQLTDAMRATLDELFGKPAEEEQAAPPRQQPEGFKRYAERAKDARDMDTAYAAYAHDQIAKKPLGKIRPGTYAQRAKMQALTMQEMAREYEARRRGASETKVITPQNQTGEKAHYKLVEADDLVASHTANSFTPDARYPANVQERDYRTEQGEQQKVARGGRFMEPTLVLSDTPTPVDGPPLVTSGQSAIVLGGNGRSMMLKRAYQEGGEAAEKYRTALREKAGAFGLDAEQVDKMRQPVLVRSIDDIQSDAPRQDLVAAVRRFNEGLTQQMSPKIRAVAQARVLTPQTVASIGELLGHGDTTLRELLREKPEEFRKVLERDGVINEQNRAKWIVGDELTDEAKDEIEGMFLGRVVGSGERLKATAPSLANKIERAVPALLRVEGETPGASEVGDVQGALDLINEAKRRGLALDDVLGQRSMFVDGRVEPRTVAMARLLAEKSGKEIARRFTAWADALHTDQQGGLFGGGKKASTPEQALAALFDGQNDDLSGPSRPADGSSLRSTTGEEPQRAGGFLTPQAADEGKKAADVKAKLSEVQAQHLINDHMADAAEQAKAEQKAIEKYIKTRSTKDQRGIVARADMEMLDIDGNGGTPYSDAHDAITQAFGFTPPMGHPIAIDGAVARLIAEDRLNFDADSLSAVLGKVGQRQTAFGEKVKPGLDGLTIDEARTVRDALTNIRKAAHAAVEVVIGEQKAEYADQVRKLQEMAAQGPARALPAPSDAGDGIGDKLAKIGNKARDLHNEMIKPEIIMRELGLNMYVDGMLDSRSKENEIARELGEKFEKAADAMPREIKKQLRDAVQGPDSPVFDSNKWTRQDLMMSFAWGGTESSMERLVKGLRLGKPEITPEMTTSEVKAAQDAASKRGEMEMHRAWDQLAKAEKDFIQSAIWDVNDQFLKPLLIAQTMKNTGVPMETIEARPIVTKDGTYRGGFLHAAYNADVSQKTAARSAFDPTKGVGGAYGDLKSGWAVGPAKGFTKSRVNGAFDVPDLSFRTYPAHVEGVLHYLAVDDYVKALGGLLRRADAREAIVSLKGKGALDALDDHMKRVARGYVEPAQGGAQQLNHIMGSVMRSRAAQAIFNVSVKTWLTQLSHVIGEAHGLGLMRPDTLLYGLARSAVGVPASLAHFTLEHLTAGAGEAVQPYAWASAREASKKYGVDELGNRWDRYTEKQSQLFGQWAPGKEPGMLGKTLDAINWTGYHVIDGFLSQWLWHSSNYKYSALPIEERVKLNDQAVRDGMPSMNLSELSSLAADRGFAGSMLLTKRFQNTLYNVAEIGTWRQRTNAFNSRGMQKAVALTGYAANLWLTWQAVALGTHVLGRFLGGHGRKIDEHEQVPAWIMRQWMIGNFAPIPFGEELATPLAEHLANSKPITRHSIVDSLGRVNPSINFTEDEYADIASVAGAGSRTQTGEDRLMAAIRAVARVSPAAGVLPILHQARSTYDVLSGRKRTHGARDTANQIIYDPKPGHREGTPLSP